MSTTPTHSPYAIPNPIPTQHCLLVNNPAVWPFPRAAGTANEEVLRLNALLFPAGATTPAAAPIPSKLAHLYGSVFGTSGTLVERIQAFVRLRSPMGKRKMVVVDNADLLPEEVQSELRELMHEPDLRSAGASPTTESEDNRPGPGALRSAQFVLVVQNPDTILQSLRSRMVLLVLVPGVTSETHAADEEPDWCLHPKLSALFRGALGNEYNHRSR